MKNPPTFLNGKSTEETLSNVKSYLSEKARTEKHSGTGKVYLEFLITGDGKTKSVKIIKGINKELDDLAIKLVEQMPSWKPGTLDGKKVSTIYVTTIDF